MQLRDLAKPGTSDENTRKHDRLAPAKVAENCGSQC